MNNNYFAFEVFSQIEVEVVHRRTFFFGGEQLAFFGQLYNYCGNIC